MVDARDLDLLQRAFRLAERGRGQTSPNPMVGAVVAAADGTIVGEGYHQQGRHAARGSARARTRPASERAAPTLYCTLEPCCHTGRTGPCAERIVAAGITRVVAAATDPNPLVAGGGFAYLRAHGIAGRGGCRAPAGRAAERRVLHVHARAAAVRACSRRPSASTAGSRRRAGARTQISGVEAQRDTQRLRAEVDAIAVGSGTVLADDPLLTVRDVYRERPLTRVVFDRRLRTPPTARLFGTRAAGPIIVLTAADAGATRGRAVRRRCGGQARGSRRSRTHPSAAAHGGGSASWA